MPTTSDLNGYLDQLPDSQPGRTVSTGSPLNDYLDHLDSLPPPPAANPNAPGQLRSGFNRSFAEVPGLAAGSAAYVADVVGADETRDKLLDYAKKSNEEVQAAHQGDAASITDAWDGKTSWPDFLKNATGYVAGQALQGIATGGLGALGGKMLATQGIKAVAERTAAEFIAKGATQEVATAAAATAAKSYAAKMAVRGAVVGAGGQNLNMELGSIYPDAVDEAASQGRTLDGMDKFRVGASALAAAGVDTAAEAITASRVFRGSNVGAGMQKQPTVLGSEILGRAVREVPAGMARESGTEGVQTVLEHYGAGQPIADEKGVRDIVDSMGVGAVGGILGGAGASFRARKVEDVGPLSRAANTAPALQIGNTPDPYLSFPDGTVARRSEIVSYINSLPPEQQPAARAKVMGLAPQPSIPQAEPATPAQAMGIDPAAGPLSSAAAIAVDTGTTQEIQRNQASEADQAAYDEAAAVQEQQAQQQDSAVNPITTGPIAEAAMSPEDKRAILFSNQTVADGGVQYTGTQDGDILNGLGKPYATRMAAQRRVQMEGKDWMVTPVFDGFVARRKDANDGTTAATAAVDQGADAGAGDQPTGSGTNSLAQPVPGTDGAGSLPGAPDGRGEPDHAVVDAGGNTISVNQEKTPPAPAIHEPIAINPIATEAPRSVTSDISSSPAVAQPGVSHVQDPTPAAQPAPDQATGTTPPTVAGDAATAQGLPAAASAAVEAAGVADYSKKWFGGQDKAQTFIDTQGIGQTHAVAKQGKRWIVSASNTALAPVSIAPEATNSVAPVSQPQGSNHGTQAPETVTPATQQQKAPERAAGKQVAPKQSARAKIEQARQARADYFTPGNIVAGYGGHDEVLSYTPPGANGEGWGVKVRAVVKQGGKWAPDPKDSRERSHSTQPGARELASGPVQRAQEPESVVSAVEAAAPVAGVAPELVKVKDIDGMNRYVKQADLDGDKPLIRMFTKDGHSNGRVHRENLDPTGEKQAADNAVNASNPFFDVITNKEGGAFATVVAARRALNQRGLQGTHIVAKASDVSSGATGFVVRRKPNSAQPEANEAAPLHQDPGAASNMKAYDGPTAAEVANVQDIPTTEKMQQAIDIVGEDEFRRLADAKISEVKKGKFDTPSDSMLIEATAISIIAKAPASAQPAAKEFTGTKQGDFYEIEGDNAKEAARILDLTLTKNRAGAPMVGWPYHAHERNVAKLAESGIAFKMAEPAKAQPAAKSAPTDILDSETSLWSRITDGTATLDEFRAGFERWVSGKDAILEALSKNKKDDLLKMGGSMFAYRNKSETKPEIVEALWRDGANQYVLARSFSHGMGKNAWLDGVRNMVENTDAEQLAQYATDRKAAQEEAVARVGKLAEAIKDPQTLDDFHALIRATKSTGKTFKEARLMLTPEQRAQYDDLTATESRADRASRKDSKQDAILRAPGEAVTASEIIQTKHTKHGHDLWQFNLDQRVSGDEFKSLVTQAKRLGGDYSSYRGNGAIPGWQFRSEEAAKAFKALIAGDTAAANDVMQERRDSFADDRSQSASERLNEMADRLDERADASLGQERKANTHKRASQAASAEAAANTEKAMAKTMRNMAQAIGAGKAKFLDRVRQKVQVSFLQTALNTAHYYEMRAKGLNIEKHRGEAPTAETADFAEFPTFTAYRSDLATLARQLLEVDGTKLLGQRLLKEADDVSDAYTAFTKANFGKVSAFSSRGGGVASFGTRSDAEASIARSGYKGKAIAYQVKRGEHAVILSPSEAIERGIWKGDGDKRISLSGEFGAEMVEKIGKAARRGAKVSVPWQLETAHDRRKALERMGIETPAEFRAALREFIGLQEQAEAPSKVKQLERAMVGRRNDGMDFFPTPDSVSDEMVAAAGIEPGMSVLEPSAGWGHIAERIRSMEVEPDVIELSGDRRELLEAKGFNVVANDFMGLKAQDIPNGEGYDRIIMNPPFSDGRDIQHVQHAYTLLKPGGRIVAIMGESAFTNQNKRATEFREWLESVGGTEEKLAEGSFNDPSLPINTGANARMVVIERGESGAIFSRSTDTVHSGGQPAARVQALVSAITARWKNAPKAVVVQSLDDPRVPEKVRNEGKKLKTDLKTIRSNDSAGSPDGFFDKDTGTVYLIADKLGGDIDVVRVLMHESLGHYGLRGQYGAELGTILDRIAVLNAAKVRNAAKRLGLDFEKPSERRLATEEVLAYMAQETPEMGWVKRTVAAVRAWLRQHIPGFGKMQLSDNELIRDYIIPARQFVEDGSSQGRKSVASEAGTPFSRNLGDALTSGMNAAVSKRKTSIAGEASSYTKIATDKLNETFSHPGKLNWWHKSFGTMNNLAERSPEFKPVFKAAQDFIDDTSYYATEAADMAPHILPKLEKWADLTKSPITAADNKAVSAPIFEGTLSWSRDESGKPVRMDDLEASYAKLDDDAKAQMLLKKSIVTENELKRWKASPLDIYTGAVRNRFETAFLTAGVVWTDSELKSQFSLTPEQIKLYREFRSTVDKSLDNLAKADLLRFGGKSIAMLTDLVMDAKDADEAAVMLRDYLHSQRDLMPERSDELTATASGMMDRADKVNKLKAQGYAPLSRFGKYTVDVVVNGERQYFSLFDTERESNKMAAKLRMEYGAAAVGQGTLSESEFKLFAGITPESLELFGNMLGLDATGNAESDKAFQTYLKLTKTNRSAMRRMIHRKGIAGFSEDAGRVLASFVYSNARQTSAALHMGALGEAVNNIPKNQGELKDAAIALADYIKNPQEEAQAVRGLLFAQYLGGSISSAFVNMTQPFAVTFPWLSQFGGAKQSGAQLLRAMKDMAAKDTVWAPDLAKALKHAEENGIVSPQEVHQLQAQARGASTLKSGDGTRTGDALAIASNAISKLSLGWGKVFGMAEQLNRRSTFIAAYRVAQAQNMKDPAAFAERAVNETQFIYSKANKMKFGRGAMGGTLMTFKTYSIAYLELLSRMATQGGPEGKKAVVLALAVMMLMGGSGGLPFMEDITDLVDGLLQRLGYNVSTKKAKQQFLEDLFGKTGADFVDRGISGLPGMPLDMTGRLGLGHIAPGIGLFQSKSSHASDLGELVGPAGDLFKRAFDASGKLLGGDVGGAALAISPVAVRNAFKGADMASTGMYRDAKGYKVLDTTMLEAALKSIGFQPESVADVQEANYINQKAKNFYVQTASEIQSEWAKGIFEKDQDQINAARARMQDWNEKNPDQRMKVNMPAVLKRVMEMRKPKDQRVADTAPKAMRAQMRRELAQAHADAM